MANKKLHFENIHFKNDETKITNGEISWSKRSGIPKVMINIKQTEEEVMKTTMNELVGNVQEWSKNKGLEKADSRGQFLKVVEESSEIAEAILLIKEGNSKGRELLEDAIGDTYVTIIILAQQHNIDFLKLLDSKSLSKYNKDLNLTTTYLYKLLGDIAGALARSNKDGLEEALKALIPELDMIATGYKMDSSKCLQVAYNVIAKRKGKMVNGVFVKQEDLDKE
ncbi:MazG-like family protein [Enterococcus mundtii]|uniref:MazG-like family protein n=1 Tax=Enterococcus mundtii TaxID=53346 RepID=UPI001A9702B4|nr:MazG-like family protein [Enterococcus mundtii]MBO1087201.1 hypothetical protein [Enterococcus mundtii]